MNNKELLITALIIVFATVIIRFLPFIIIRKSIAERKYIKFLGDMMPYSMIALLVIYCLKEVNLIKYPYEIPELISIAIIIILHIIKRNVLISIGVGTVVYMILVQTIFI
ncbi:branched-chain amino acid transporter AzlD [Brachyspira aalborgi]|uniref:Branched-chain amino acid transporter AzlD n=1 Tax=Brachyspira aalborgi TaxID=29522 RepID=A0A5C8GF79_9SPIR|nr:AzlD domain-containing protein [Brachyspira aalborgi]TXJ60389.1 branched-chain amino acid transporter AzlD [Brachyspira aalborgi]